MAARVYYVDLLSLETYQYYYHEHENFLSLEVLKRLFSWKKERVGDIFNPMGRATPIIPCVTT